MTSSAERIAAEVIESHKLPTLLAWIEHYPPETTDETAETFGLVVFDSYEVRGCRAKLRLMRLIRRKPQAAARF